MEVSSNDYMNIYIDKLFGKINEQTKLILQLEVQLHFAQKRVNELTEENNKLKNQSEVKEAKIKKEKTDY